ncbi:MAG TPA: hypothetical protein VMA35_12385 [Candidatus Sulfopaludibacter sp.]|nr:hypothetical protein [Candidatus Sulfopaludibacter sp.]
MTKIKKNPRFIAVASIWSVLGLVTLWAAALYFDAGIPWLRLMLAAVYGLGMLAVWIEVRRPWKAVHNAGGFVLVLTWWFSLQPSNHRDWRSKRAFTAIMFLSTISDGDGNEQLPLITIPAQ